jgi:hypothetical protein
MTALLTPTSVRRTTVVDVTMAMALATVQAEAMITTHSSNSPLLTGTAAPQLRSLPHPQPIPQVVRPLTLMPCMAVIRTISPCGMPRLLNSSSKEGNRPSLDPRLSRVCFDVAHVAETPSIDAYLHDQFWTLLRVA